MIPQTDSNRLPEMIFAKVKEKAQKGHCLDASNGAHRAGLAINFKYLQQEGYALVTVSQVLN